jgi:hypothetical protein
VPGLFVCKPEPNERQEQRDATVPSHLRHDGIITLSKCALANGPIPLKRWNARGAGGTSDLDDPREAPQWETGTAGHEAQESVRGALRWWGRSKAEKPPFLKRSSPAPVPFCD